MCLTELIPLVLVTEWHHDAPDKSTGGVWFLREKLQLQDGYQADAPLLWRLKWPEFITRNLVTDTNPEETITN